MRGIGVFSDQTSEVSKTSDVSEGGGCSDDAE